MPTAEISQQVQLSASRFARREIAPVAAQVDHHDAPSPSRVFASGLAVGLDRCILPEEAGGYGFTPRDLCELVTGLARACPGHAMVFGVHAAAVRGLWETGETAGTCVERVLAGAKPLAVAFPEPDRGGFASEVRCVEAEEGELQLRGRCLAANSDEASPALLFAHDAGGLPRALVLFGEDASGTREAVLGLRAMPIRALRFEAQRVPAAGLVAEGEPATQLHRRLLRSLSLVTAAAAQGVMTSALQLALDYANQRYQGGKQIIDHTHLRTILGSMIAKQASGRGAIDGAASRLDDPHAALATKVTLTEDALQLCTDAVQILGGYGYTRDYGLEKAMRDAAVLALLPVSNARIELLLAESHREQQTTGGR